MRVAAVDIGSNTVRLLIAESSRDGLITLEHRVEIVGLGRGVDKSGRLTPKSIERALGVLYEFGSAVADAEVGAVRAVATSASRDSANVDKFFDLAETALGTRPELISGEEEAHLGFAGATADIEAPGPYLVIDPGGGSTEFVVGDAEPHYAISTEMGSVRLTDRVLSDRPPSPDQLHAARAAVAGVFDEVEIPQQPALVIGVAGTFTTLAALHLGLPEYDRERVHHTVLEADDLHRWEDRLAQLSREETAALPSMHPGRAPVILSGAVIAVEALRISGAERLVVSERDMLDAIAASLAGDS